MHLAASVGTPCVAIFAAVDWPGRWEPFGSGHQTFRRQVECEGCFTSNCFNNNQCLELINADEVYGACLQILNREETT
jgi:ADP-heptose:LPS heptosyltransferase